MDEREGPGYIPMHIKSKGYPKSESEMEEQFSLGEYRAYDNTVT
jgi:hypothetical protein